MRSSGKLPAPGTASARRISDLSPAGQPPLKALEPAAARWISAVIRIASTHPAMTRILEVIERLQERPFHTNVLVQGPPGSGKEGLARALHELMAPGAPLVRLDTVGLDDEQALDALCGRGRRAGAAERARGGTLLVEEVAELPARAQGELLRIVKTGVVDRRGQAAGRARSGESTGRSRPFNVIALTDQDLPGLVAARRFRHDLYFRLARLVLTLPPLHERLDDLGPAAIWMGNRLLRDAGVPLSLWSPEDAAAASPAERRRAIVLEPSALDALRAHPWPGNFRELEVVMERALLLYREGDSVDAATIQRALE